MDNVIGKTLRIVGYLTIALGIIGGIIVWISVAAENSRSLTGPIAGISIIVSSIIIGILFLGFSEIICLLQKNNDILEDVHYVTENDDDDDNEYDEQLDENVTSIDEDNNGSEKVVNKFVCPFCDKDVYPTEKDYNRGTMKCPYCNEYLYLEYKS